MPAYTTDDFTMHYEVHGPEHSGIPVILIMGITAPTALPRTIEESARVTSRLGITPLR
jgi:hypothetical protein